MSNLKKRLRAKKISRNFKRFGVFCCCFLASLSIIAKNKSRLLQLQPAQISKEIAVENPPLYPLSSVKEGQVGYGYTVFRNVEGPQKFSFKVLGVMRDYLGPGEDLIIAELLGKQIEATGVIAGMSGSPVYIGKSLVGAVSYRFGQFTNKAIAGITPIESMLKIAEATEKDMRENKINRVKKTDSSSEFWGKASAIQTPLWVDTLAPEIRAAFTPRLEKLGYVLNQKMSAAHKVTAKKSKHKKQDLSRFYAAGPIAAALVAGDLNMVGVGTVTWVDKNRFLAFGHPFLGHGESTMPVGNAEIVVTVASGAGSWKMGQLTGLIGQLEDDRLHAIGGTMGTLPPLIPLHVEFELEGPRAEKDAQQKFDVRIAHFPDSALYAAMSFAQSLAERVNVEQGGRYILTGEIQFSGQKPLFISESLALERGTLGYTLLAFRLLDKMESILNNPWQKTVLKSINLKVQRKRELKQEKLLAVEVLEAFQAGSASWVEATFQSHHHGLKKKRFRLNVPSGVSAGDYTLAILSRQSIKNLEEKTGHFPDDTSVEMRIARLNSIGDTNKLSIYLVNNEQSPSLNGQSLSSFPVAYQQILSPFRGNADANRYQSRVLLQNISWDAEISASLEIPIYIKEHKE